MDFIIATSIGLGKLLLLVFAIVVPLIIVLEIFREFNILDRFTNFLFPLARIMGFKKESIYPLIAGILFGITYGGGVLIGESSSGRIDARQSFLVALFLGLCHAMIEDTLLFVAQGANPLIIVPFRFVLAFIIVFIASLFIKEGANGAKEIRG